MSNQTSTDVIVRQALESAATMLGACHIVEDGPCRADCPVCVVQEQVNFALDVISGGSPDAELNGDARIRSPQSGSAGRGLGANPNRSREDA